MTDGTARVHRVRELFDAVIDLPAAERGAALDQLTAGDAALRREVEEVISGAESTASILESPVVGMSTVSAASISSVPGSAPTPSCG